jgi:hypothetical protein
LRFTQTVGIEGSGKQNRGGENVKRNNSISIAVGLGAAIAALTAGCSSGDYSKSGDGPKPPTNRVAVFATTHIPKGPVKPMMFPGNLTKH